MDLDYMQKYSFSTIGGSGGIPLVDNATFITSLTGGSLFTELVIPGGLVYNPDHNYESTCFQEEDPAEIGVKEDFDSLLDLVTFVKPTKNITVKRKSNKPEKKTRNKTPR